MKRKVDALVFTKEGIYNRNFPGVFMRYIGKPIYFTLPKLKEVSIKSLVGERIEE